MIARLTAVLPHHLYLPAGLRLSDEHFSAGGYEVTLHPPESDASYSVSNSPISTVEIAGETATRANVLRIDFHKVTFEMPEPEGEIIDPPPTLCLELINQILERMRVVTRQAYLNGLSDLDEYRIDYLSEEGEEVAYVSSSTRRRFQFGLITISQDVWDAVLGLGPKYIPAVWVRLLLDAESLLPQVGPAIVLMAAAHETLIGACLKALADREVTVAELWKCMVDREQSWQEPSVADCYDRILRVLGGRSLKERPDLWEAFKNIREARNNLVHQGQPLIGGSEVTPAKAAQLLGKSESILSWIEELLPSDQRRPAMISGPRMRVVLEVDGDKHR